MRVAFAGAGVRSIAFGFEDGWRDGCFPTFPQCFRSQWCHCVTFKIYNGTLGSKWYMVRTFWRLLKKGR
jgi:hypothetical protein